MKLIDYRLKSKRIIKWYEYKMQYPDDETSENELPEVFPEDIPDAMEVQETLNNMIDEEEEIDLATTGLDEDDQALVADILARFKEAKQNSVDDLFSAIPEDSASSSDTSSESAVEDTPMSEEELIAAICAPKQNNVDALVGEARSGM